MVLSLLFVLLSNHPAAADPASHRTESEPYFVGLDGATSCETNIGGACFDLVGDERLASIHMEDATGLVVAGIYEVRNASGATLTINPFCESVTFDVPDHSTLLIVYAAGPAFGILSCQFQDGNPAAATTGSITVTYALTGQGGRPYPFDEERECLEGAPAAAGVSGITDDGARISLDVMVLLDGVEPALGQQIFDRGAISYSPLGIDLTPTFVEVEFKGTEIHGMLTQAKDRFHGERPPGKDVVYVLTSKALTLLGLPVAAGLADCIGGVRFPERAFAVGTSADFTTPVGPITFDTNIPAKTAAHEIGHLMGGQHHLANCVEGIPTELAEEHEPSACTLMFNAADFVSHNFSVVNGLVVRGHAAEFARP